MRAHDVTHPEQIEISIQGVCDHFQTKTVEVDITVVEDDRCRRCGKTALKHQLKFVYSMWVSDWRHRE